MKKLTLTGLALLAGLTAGCASGNLTRNAEHFQKADSTECVCHDTVYINDTSVIKKDSAVVDENDLDTLLWLGKRLYIQRDKYFEPGPIDSVTTFLIGKSILPWVASTGFEVSDTTEDGLAYTLQFMRIDKVVRPDVFKGGKVVGKSILVHAEYAKDSNKVEYGLEMDENNKKSMLELAFWGSGSLEYRTHNDYFHIIINGESNKGKNDLGSILSGTQDKDFRYIADKLFDEALQDAYSKSPYLGRLLNSEIAGGISEKARRVLEQMIGEK